MPTLSEAYDVLRAILDGPPPIRTIDLAVEAGRRPALAALGQAIALLGRPTTLIMTGASLTGGGRRALLAGDARVPLAGSGSAPTPVRVALTLTEPQADTVLFSLALTITADDWTFDTTFPVLPPTLRVNANGLTVSYGSSALAKLVVEAPTFTASSAPKAALRLSGLLRPSGDLLPYQDWVGPWPLRLDGAVKLPATTADPPLLELRAAADQGTIGEQPVRLRNPGFSLVAAANPDEDSPGPATFSELRLAGTAEFGGGHLITADLSATLLVSRDTWRLMADFGEQPPSLAGGLAQLATLFGLDMGDLRTPPALGGFETFQVDEVEVWLNSGNGGLPDSVSAIAATIRSNRVWEPPIPFLKVSGVGTRWALQHTVLGGADRVVIAGSVFGSLEFTNSGGKDPGIVDLTGVLPSFVITGRQREGTEINLSAALRQLLGPDTLPVPGNPSVTDLVLGADPFGQLFDASATVNLELAVPLLRDTVIAQVSFEVHATASSLWGGLEGRLRLPTPGAPELYVRAETPKAAATGWVFSGGLAPGTRLSLGELLGVAELSVPDGFNALTVSRLEASVETGADGPWSFAGAIGVAFRPTILGTQVAIAAGMELELARPRGSAKGAGWVAGELTVNRLLVRMRRDLGVEEPTYALRVQFADIWLQAATAWVDDKSGGKSGEKPGRHQVIAVTLGGATLGEVLEELVGLVAPTLGFRLEPPWDVLNRIELSRFTLTVDPTDRVIELTYQLNQDLLVMSIEKIGVKATLGDAGKVELSLYGTLLGQDYTKGKPLSWDVANDPPPAVPGQGPKLVELRYLALGQRLRLPTQPETVAEAIKLLREDMREPPPGTVNPLTGGSLLKFDSASGLLAALDLRVLETVQVALVFNDPRLYGLFVALDGEKAGELAGLRFEVLYKRLPSGIGMFRTELRVPDKFRRIELGEVSIGLGTIVVEVYTNGNFLVDLGFPHDRDFTRSFDAMVFPFLGRGGVYFGVLNGETSRRVPAIGNGTFSPVLELGVGLAVGVGKEIAVGPLSGGAYVELEVIFEGVLAWFNPSGKGQAAVLYHKAQGIVAIHGKVYASVDFTVVKAMVTLEAYAQASVVFEAYRATVFGLYVKFDAEAEIQILSFTVPLSFSAELDLSFAVGSDEPTPWTVTAAQPPRLAAVRAPRRLLRVQRAQALLAASAGGPAADATWNWAPDFAAFAAPRTLDISLLPAFTVQHPLVSWGSATPLEPAEPDWQVAFPLFARNGVSAGARTAREAAAPPFDPSSPVAAASLVEALLRWAISGLPAGVSEPGKVTAGQLTLLGEELAKPYVARTQFTRDRLATFFGTNLHLRISGPAGAASAEAGTGTDTGTGAGADPKSVGAMVFPAPPWITIRCARGDVADSADLFTFNRVGPAYSAAADAYLAGFQPVTASGELEHDDPAQYQSFAARVFCDWSLMVAREAVRLASASLAGLTVAMAATLDATAGTLPSDLVQYRVRPGDTLERLAAELGAGTAELEALNPGLAGHLAAATPGEVLPVRVGVAGCTLAADNAALPLAPGLTVTLTKVRVQVRSQDSLSTLATRLYGNAQPATLAALVAGATVAEVSLADATLLLRPGALVTVPQRPDPLSGSHTPALFAAVMYVRCFAPADVPDAEWYAQAIAGADANRDKLQDIGPGQPLPAGRSLVVPNAYLGPLTASYQTQPGDTLLRIGAALSLAYAPDGYPAPSWASFRADVRALGGTAVPAVSVAVLPGESLTALAARLVLAGDAGALVPLLAGQPALDPLAPVEVAALPVSTTGRTLAAIAQLTGLSIAQVAKQPGVTSLPGLFASGTPLRVTHLPAQTIDQLVRSVCGGAGLGEISARSSRALLAGIRLPAPHTEPDGTVTAAPPLTGAFKLAGQQFSAPARNTTGLTVTVGPSTGAPQGWITFAQEPDGPAESQLTFGYTSGQLAGLYPKGAFARAPHSGPTAIPVAGTVPRTYGFEQRTELQVAQALPIPGADSRRITGTATLWRFPAALLDKARAASTTPFDILRAGPDGVPVADHEVVTDATFATVVSLRIRRAPGRRHAYELLGADPDDARLLRELALSPATTQQTSLAIAMAPAPGAGPEMTGLTVFDANPDATFVIRANMATDLPLTTPPTVVSASLAQRASFLHLIWEASLGGSGYHFGFATADGADLPVGAFDPDGTGTLWLIVIRADARLPKPDGRILNPADNCALIAPGLDAPLHALYAEAHGVENQPCPYRGELVTQALVPAGSAGVTLALPRGDDATTQLFSLVVSVIDGAPFTTSQVGPAAPPLREDGRLLPRWVRERELRAARIAAGGTLTDPPPAAYWRYDQVVPLYRYASPSLLDEVPGLPQPADDPYRGFQSGTGQAQATFRLGLADVFGNVSREPFDAAAQVAAGYTDLVLGPAAWPATATAFSVGTKGGFVNLVVTVTAQPSNAVPGPLDPPQAAAEAAARQAARFADVVYQLTQPTERGTLLTTLATGSDGQPAALPLAEGRAPLWRFAAASYVAADAAAQLVPPPLTGLTTLGEVSDHFGLPLGALGPANAGTPIQAIAQAGQTVTVTSRLPVIEGDSATSLLGRVQSGWPTPSPVQLLKNNAALPLRPGTVLSVPGRPLPLGPQAPRLTLAGVAAQHQTTAAQLAIDVKDLAVLSTGFAFTAAGQTVTVGELVNGLPVTTLAGVQAAFGALAVDVAVAELADAAADSTGLFAVGATLTQTHVVAVPASAPPSPTTPAPLAPPLTLATLAGPDLDAVAAAAAGQPNLWAAGTQVTLGTRTVSADSPEPLGLFAERHGSTAALLLAENPALRLASDPPLVLPGTCAVPAKPARPLRSTHTTVSGDRLDILAGLFGTTPSSIARGNQNTRGLLVPGHLVSVSVGTQRAQTTTEAGETLAALTARLRQQVPAVNLDAVASAIAADPAILNTDRLLVMPLPALAQPAAGGGPAALTLSQVAAAYQVDGLAFAQANAALCGVLAPGVTLSVPGGPAQVTAPTDTLNAVLSRCAAAGSDIDLAGLLNANPRVALIKRGAPALLPPSPVSVSAPLGPVGGPFRFPKPVFPVSVTLRLERDQNTVLIDDPAVRLSDTAVPPATGEAGTLDGFATAFEAALPTLRLGTARTSGERADLWAVNFGPDGIKSVAVTPGVAAAPGITDSGGAKQPRFLALRPLYPELQSRTGDKVQVPVLDANGKITDKTTPLEFQGADVEAWARQLLADIDLFLSAPYAVGMHGHPGLDDLLRAKWTLARAVARGLAPVLAVTDARQRDGTATAVTGLARDLGVSLSAGYDVAAIVQYDVTADTAYSANGTALRPARLSGGARPPESPNPSAGEFALAAAATDLAARASFVSFAMTVPDPGGHRSVRTEPLEYVYDSVEFDIDTTADAPDGYEASSWLHFIRPLSGIRRPAGITADLGSPQVPVPLRAHPPVPVLVEQTAAPTYHGIGQPALAQAAQWTFAVTYSHEHKAQDQVLLEVRFNVSRAPAPRAAGPDLAVALARYAALGDQLRQLMTVYLDPDDPRGKARDAVAGTVAALVGEIAAAWDAHWPAQAAAETAGPRDGLPPGETRRRFLVALGYEHPPGGGERLSELTLKLDARDPVPGPEGWPAVFVRDADERFVPLQRSPVNTRESLYRPAATVPVTGQRVVRLEWPGLNVAVTGNATAAVSARRNADLITGTDTNPAFLMSSATVTAPDLATPLLTWTGELPLHGDGLGAALGSALADLFGSASGPPVTLGLSYGHQLVAPPGDGRPGLKSYLPAALYPAQPLSSSALPAALARAAATWQAASHPATEGGEWVVSLTLSSWLDPVASRPLLVINRLVLPASG